MNVHMEVDDAALLKAFKEAPGKVTNGISDWMYRTALRTERAAKQKVPVKQGYLQNSIRTSFSSKLNATVKPVADYALYVHEGTGIYAKNGKGRKTGWFVKSDKGTMKGKDGELGFWTRGTKPKPFMDNAYKEVKSDVDRDAKLTLSKIVESI